MVGEGTERTRSRVRVRWAEAVVGAAKEGGAPWREVGREGVVCAAVAAEAEEEEARFWRECFLTRDLVEGVWAERVC